MTWDAKQIAKGGMFAALVFLCTYLIKLPIPGGEGYIHLGDGMIFFSALYMGPLTPWVAGLGSALSDLMAGYSLYALPTFIIKALMGLMAYKLTKPGATVRNGLVFLGAEALMVLDYGLLEWVLYGFPAAVASIPFNLIQGAAGIAIGMAISLAHSNQSKGK